MAWLEAYTRGWRWLVIPAFVWCALPRQAGAQSRNYGTTANSPVRLRVTLPPDIPWKKFTRRPKYKVIAGDFIEIVRDSLFLRTGDDAIEGAPVATIITIEQQVRRYNGVILPYPRPSWALPSPIFSTPLAGGGSKTVWEPVDVQRIRNASSNPALHGELQNYTPELTVRDRDRAQGFYRWRIGIQPVYGFAIPKPLRSDGGGGIYYGCKVRTTIPRYSQMTFDLALLRNDVYPDRDENYRIKSTTLTVLANYYVFGPTDALFISGGYGVYRNHHAGNIVQNNSVQTAQGLNAGAGINIHLRDRVAVELELFRMHFVKDAGFWTFGAGLLVWVN